MTTLQERLHTALKLHGSSKAALAVAVGAKPPSISAWFSGETKTLEASNLLKAARHLGVSPDWLATGIGPMMLLDAASGEAVNVIPASLSGVRIPVINYVQAGMWSGVIDGSQHGDADDWLTTDRQFSRSAFALEIKGKSMLPKFEPGDRVIIDPDVAPLPGDFVVAKNGEEEATFKKYRPRGADASGETIFELVPLNDDFATIKSSDTHVRIVGTMVEHRMYRRAR